MLSSSNQAFGAISFFTLLFLLVIFCARLRIQSERLGGLTVFAAWTGVSSLILLVDNFLWDFKAVPVWCDISSRILLASSSALLASSLCISARIYYRATSARPDPQLERRLVWAEIILPLAFPLIQLALLCAVQDGRFTIYEDYGCRMQMKGGLSYLLIQGPMFLVSIVACYYALRADYGFWERTGSVSGESAMVFQGATILTIGIYLAIAITTRVLDVVRIAPSAEHVFYHRPDFTTVTLISSHEISRVQRDILNLEKATSVIFNVLVGLVMLSSTEVTRGFSAIPATIASRLGRDAGFQEKTTSESSSSSLSLPLPSIARWKKERKPSEPPKQQYVRFLPPSQKPANRNSALIPAGPEDMSLPDTGGLLRALSRSLSARSGKSGRASKFKIKQITVPPHAVHNIHIYHDQETAMRSVSPALTSPSLYSIESAEQNVRHSRVPVYDAFVYNLSTENQCKHC